MKRSSYGFNKQLKGKNKVISQKDLLFSFGDFIFQKERISAEAESKSTCLMDKRRIQCFAMISNYAYEDTGNGERIRTCSEERQFRKNLHSHS